MTNEQHENMLKKIVPMKSKIMISGYDCELYNNYLKDWRRLEFTCPNAFSNATEVIWMNYEKEKKLKGKNLLEFC